MHKCNNCGCCLEEKVESDVEVVDYSTVRYIDLVEVGRKSLSVKISKDAIGKKIIGVFAYPETIKTFEFKEPLKPSLMYARY